MSSERELVRGLTIRNSTAEDLARWPGCDRVLSDCNTSTPMYPGEDEDAAAREWLATVAGNGGA